ncbi:hypothetical protein [Haloarcula argentinensis]|nr:hypothetical protein [Haloarcula argentinensis]
MTWGPFIAAGVITLIIAYLTHRAKKKDPEGFRRAIRGDEAIDD